MRVLTSRIRPILGLQCWTYYRVPFLATGAFVVTLVDIGFVAGLTAVVVGVDDEFGAAPVVVFTGSGSLTGVTGVVGLGTGFAVTVAM